MPAGRHQPCLTDVPDRPLAHGRVSAFSASLAALVAPADAIMAVATATDDDSTNNAGLFTCSPRVRSAQNRDGPHRPTRPPHSMCTDHNAMHMRRRPLPTTKEFVGNPFRHRLRAALDALAMSDPSVTCDVHRERR